MKGITAPAGTRSLSHGTFEDSFLSAFEADVKMTARLRLRGALGALVLLSPFAETPRLEAATAAIEITQTGGFFADAAGNSIAHQNYFVGYGTTPGFGRTGERRSFFYFDLSMFTPDDMILSATLHLALPFGGLIFGITPDEPPALDPFETFQLSATPYSAAAVTSPLLPESEILAIFDSFKGPSLADPVIFLSDGTPPHGALSHDYGLEIVIPVNALGISFLNFKAGSDIVFTGYMPTWTHDDRLSPSPPPLYLEASELIFGLTDIHAGHIPKPVLLIEYMTIPEPSKSLLLLLASFFALAIRRRQETPR